MGFLKNPAFKKKFSFFGKCIRNLWAFKQILKGTISLFIQLYPSKKVIYLKYIYFILSVVQLY